jgi:hypothetical protein
MLRTITLGSCVSVQGIFERQLENGKILVRVGKLIFEGFPVTKKGPGGNRRRPPPTPGR